MVKHSYTEIFIAVLYSAGYDNAQTWAIAQNIAIQYNTIHCMHKSNVKLIYTISIW